MSQYSEKFLQFIQENKDSLPKLTVKEQELLITLVNNNDYGRVQQLVDIYLTWRKKQ